MEKDKDKIYAPKEGDAVEDPIVSQYIACQEFDYTSNELLIDENE